MLWLQNITVTQPYERIPLWHKQGSVLVSAQEPALRVAQLDWSRLDVDVFLAPHAFEVTRRVLGPENAPSEAHLQVHFDGRGNLTVALGAASDGLARAWRVRVRLQPGQAVAVATLLEAGHAPLAVRHYLPVRCDQAFFPFLSEQPACQAGPVAVLELEQSAAGRTLAFVLA